MARLPYEQIARNDSDMRFRQKVNVSFGRMSEAMTAGLAEKVDRTELEEYIESLGSTTDDLDGRTQTLESLVADLRIDLEAAEDLITDLQARVTALETP